MTLPPFDIHRPTTVLEATTLLHEYGDSAALYCGGTELLLLMKLGFAEYRHLICVRDIPELRGVHEEEGVIHIGAATTHRELERSPVIQQHCPEFVLMERHVANIRVRSAGTLGGNLCFADPHSDPGTFLLVTGADLVCNSAEATRTVPIAEFLLGPYQTVLAEGELLSSIDVPRPPNGSVIVHRKLSFHERPAVTITCLVRVDGEAIVDVRVAVGSVGVVPVRASASEAILRGLSVDHPHGADMDAACEAAAGASQAMEDSNGSPEYKRNLVRVLVQRCFSEALRAAHV